MATKLESLVVDLQVNAAAMRQGLDEANKKLNGFSAKLKEMSKHAKEAGQAIAFHIGKEAVEKLAHFVLKGAEFQDQMIKSARAAGLASEPFSKLSYAFGLAGVSSEGFGTAMKKLNVTMAEAHQGERQQAALFKAMGIEIHKANGELRDGGDVLKDVATLFSTMEDGAAKSAIAVELFGKQGAAMISGLNGGAEGLEKLGDEAQRFGLVVSEKAGKAAEEFVDNVHRVKLAVTGVAAQVAANVAPTFEHFTKQLLNSREGADFLKGAVMALTGGFRALMSVGALLSYVFEIVGKTVARVANVLWNLVQGEFLQAADDAGSLLDDIEKDIGDAAIKAAHNLKEIWNPKPVEENAERVKKISGATADKIYRDAKRIEEAGKVSEAAFKKLVDVALDLETKWRTFGAKSPIEEMKYRLEKGDLAAELKKIGAEADALKWRILSAVQALEDLKIAKEDADIQRDVERKGAERSRSDAQRRADFANIGKADTEIFAGAVAGFKDFNDALTQAAEQTQLQTDLLNAAKIFERDKEYELAHEQTMLADQAGEAAAKAGKAADAFEQAAKDAAAAGAEVRAKLVHAFANVGGTIQVGLSSLFAKMGASGEIAQTGVAAFQAGGIWAALIAVVIELMSKIRSWTDLMDKSQKSVDKLMGDIGGALDAVVQALMVFFDALQPLKDLIHKILDPILKIVAQVITAFAAVSEVITSFFKPALEFIGELFKQIEVVLRPVTAAFRAIMDVLKPVAEMLGSIGIVLKVLEPIFWLVGKVLGMVAITLLAISWAFGKLINAIAGKNVVDTDTMEKQMVAISKDIMGTTARGTSFEASGISGDKDPNSNKDIDTQAETTKNVEGFNDAIKDTTKTVAKFNQAFTNLPEGFKVALRSFQSMDPTRDRIVGGINSGVTVVVNVAGGVMTTVEKLTEAIQMQLARKRFRTDGIPDLP